jgi:hypothetical protein
MRQLTLRLLVALMATATNVTLAQTSSGTAFRAK